MVFLSKISYNRVKALLYNNLTRKAVIYIKEFNIASESINPFSLIGKDWFLLSAGTPENFNTMTASWGGMGVMWGKNVFLTVVRPSRHTFGYIKEQPCFSVCFFSEEHRATLQLCGSASGRDIDKVAKSGLTPIFLDGVPAFAEAKKIFICKKMYENPLNEGGFIAEGIASFYEKDPLHVAFAGEILAAYEND